MSEKIKRIDFLGALSMVSAVSLLLVGLSMGGEFAFLVVVTGTVS